MRQVTKWGLLAGMIILLASCVTQKRRDDLSALGKLYHNTTARYNGYFNANELLTGSIEQLSAEHQDNFKKLLPVYDYVASANPQAVAPNLDKAIEKVSVVVNLHRQSHWTDDCYLLVGKAQYLKKDYERAEETLRYFVNEFNPDKPKKGSKKKVSSRRPSGGSSSASSAEGEEKPDISQMSEREQRRYKKQQEKERKRYNREVKQRKKKEQRQRKKQRKNKSRTQTSRKEEAAKAAENQTDPTTGTPDASSGQQKPVNSDDKKKSSDRKKEKQAEAKAKAEARQAAKDDNYFLKHRPVYQEGVLWLARTYIERQRFEEAMRLILQLERDPATFDDIRQELAAVKAHYFLRQGEVESAITPLENAIAESGNRKEKARFAFIMAQIHEQEGRHQEAYAGFERVLGYGPLYEMAFNSRIHLLENGWRAGSLTAESTKDQLARMARDPKNDEFLDQVYFALASIELETGNREEGIRNLELSLAKSKGNQQQRSDTYMRLAYLYLEGEDFVPAQRYFDSTLTVLPNTDDRYPEVKRWRDNLTDIAKNLEVIAYQDSMLALAAMPEAERRSLASRIKKERDAERLQALAVAAQTAANNRQQASQTSNRNVVAAANLTAAGTPTNPNQAGASTFFAYDDRDVKRGKRDFTRKWGDRPLEDNWRRSSSRGSGNTNTSADSLSNPVASNIPTDEVEEIFKDMPKTDGEKLAAQLKVQEALFNLGVLYRERLSDLDKSVEALEVLNKRFDRTNFQLDSWYYLYLDHTDLKQAGQADEYARRIQEKYPSSTYARVLRNPNYAAELKEEKNRLNRYYEETYEAFNRGEYAEVQKRCQEATGAFGAQNPLQPKFALLAAMCTGNLQGRDAYITALNDLIARYPETNEQKRAREILRLLGEKTATLPGDLQAEVPTEFERTDDQLHYILIVFNEDIGLNDSKVKVSNYHLKYHKLDKLSISNIYLGSESETRVPILVVRRFKNKAEAMNYYSGVMRNKNDFVDPAIDYEIFAVSQNNYREILRSKSVVTYRDFFNQNYLD